MKLVVLNVEQQLELSCTVPGPKELCLLFHNNNSDLSPVLLSHLNDSMQILGPAFYSCHLI